MWSLRKLFPGRSAEFVTAANWQPQYYYEEYGQQIRPPGTSVRFGGRKVPKQQPQGIISWGDMDATTCGHRVLEALMGLFSVRRPDCPKHFWCKPQDVRYVAQCYTAHPYGDPHQRIYIGIYNWRILDHRPTDIPMSDGTTSPGVVMTSVDAPAYKMLLFPLTDGSIQVTYGPVRSTGDDGDSYGGQGVIDRDVGETLYCASRRVSGIPSLSTTVWGADNPQPCYLIAHDDDQWWAGPCWRSKSNEWTSTGFSRVLPAITLETHQPIYPHEYR